MSDYIYGAPEKYGLRTIGEIQWGQESYSFDLTVVWQDTTTGAFYFADDAGCSCPAPFGDTGRNDLTLIDKPQTFIDHVNKRVATMGESYFSDEEIGEAKGDAGQLVLKIREATR